MTSRHLLFLIAIGVVFFRNSKFEVFAIEDVNQSSLRVATFNVSLYRKQAGKLAEDLERGDKQAEQLAKIIHRVNPDVILLNEIDDDGGKAAKIFQEKYLNLNQNDGAKGDTSSSTKQWPYLYTPSVNTGVDSGLDLDNNGKTGTASDCWGYGEYPGQYGLVVLSRFPIDESKIRTFQKFLWRDMPDALRPKNLDGTSYWNDSIWSQLRLSSKTHADIPVNIGNHTLHLLVSHPTPPVFDGPEDRNGYRNNDEIRFWKDYIEWPIVESAESSYHIDDKGIKGSIEKGASFVILGDLNADPIDGSGLHTGIQGLLDSKRVSQMKAPASSGAVQAAEAQAKQNLTHKGDPANDTGDFNDGNPGNLRCDFVLPSADLKVLNSGVYWPRVEALGDDDKKLLDATDHRMVWLDLECPLK